MTSTANHHDCSNHTAHDTSNVCKAASKMLHNNLPRSIPLPHLHAPPGHTELGLQLSAHRLPAMACQPPPALLLAQFLHNLRPPRWVCPSPVKRRVPGLNPPMGWGGHGCDLGLRQAQWCTRCCCWRMQSSPRHLQGLEMQRSTGYRLQTDTAGNHHGAFLHAIITGRMMCRPDV